MGRATGFDALRGGGAVGVGRFDQEEMWQTLP